jgi:hypothetical protein
MFRLLPTIQLKKRANFIPHFLYSNGKKIRRLIGEFYTEVRKGGPKMAHEYCSLCIKKTEIDKSYTTAGFFYKLAIKIITC